MAIDALTLTAILVMVLIAGVVVRICTMSDNACSGPNEYLDRKREQDHKEEDAA
jgi:hypothetical protein